MILEFMLFFIAGFAGGYFLCMRRVNELQQKLNNLTITRLHRGDL